MSKSNSEYNGIMYKLSIKYSLNSHPWAVTSWLQSVMLWGNTTRDKEYMCRDGFMDCLRLSFYAYLLFSLVLYSLCMSNSISMRFVQGCRGHGHMVVGNLKSYGGHWVIRSGRWCWARGYNTTKAHEMNIATYDQSRCFCHIWICE